jgi:class 3 adenylate cyclase/tetratricopeptide (TPR) repeat protein
MSSEHEQLLVGIAALEAQRAQLGDGAVDASIAALRSKLRDLVAGTPAELAQTLRQVSILFVDVVGSTAFAQHLDPEEVHAVMDRALARCTAVVEDHHGNVLQYAGDSVPAVFGAHEAKEDDAERAVRCGLGLLGEGQRLGAEVLAAHGHAGFDVRVGIHTGDVLLGGGVEAEGTIRGIAVHIAARMEQTAPAGALRISHDTYCQVRGLFDIQAQDPIVVRGVDAPIQSYLVRNAKPRAFGKVTRGIEGVATRMIGREAELEALRHAFRRLFAKRTLAVVTVVAEAGVGKSRLLTEFETWSETTPEAFTTFRGRSSPNSQSQPYGLLRDILAWRLQIADDDSLEAARAKLEQGLMPLFLGDDGEDVAEGHAHLLGHLLGIDDSASRHIRGIRDDPKQIRNRAFHAEAQMFRRVSARDGTPVVLQLEDLHWADDASLDFLDYLTQVNRDVPMLVLAMARPTLFERRPDRMSAEGVHQRIDLLPLDATGSRLLADELLKKLPEVPAGLRELLTGGAEGNPFYMEELVKMLIDQGAIQTGGPHGQGWTLDAPKLMGTKVPPSLTGVLQARLDGLPAPEKLAIQQASVIGAVFWDRALIALDARSEHALPALVRRELALPHTGATPYGDLREYAFRHHILHQVTYDTVLKRTRRELHDKVARWLAGLTGLRASDFLGIAADHYERAGNLADAVEYHARAAEHAESRFAHDAALQHARRALALLDTLSKADPHASDSHDAALQMRWRLVDVCEQTLDLQGRRSEQRTNIDSLGALAEALDDDGRRAYVSLRRCEIALSTGEWSVCEVAARQAMSLAARAGDRVLRLKALQRLVVSLAYLGHFESSRELTLQGLAESREYGLRLNEADLLHAQTTAAWLQGDFMATLQFCRQSLSIQRQIGNRLGEAFAFNGVALALSNLGEFESARHELEEGLRLMRTNGDLRGECAALLNLSEFAHRQGDQTRALELARSALEMAVATEGVDCQAIALICIGNAEIELGRHSPATETFEQARARARQIGDPVQHDATAGLMRLALARGDTATALHLLDELLAHLAAGGTLLGTQSARRIELTCHEVLKIAHDMRAGEWLARAHENLQASAAMIPDEVLRHGFLTNIPEHREIVTSWAAWQRAGDGASAII